MSGQQTGKPGGLKLVKDQPCPDTVSLELEDGTRIQANLSTDFRLLKIQTEGLGTYAVTIESARQFANHVLWLLFDADPKRQG